MERLALVAPRLQTLLDRDRAARRRSSASTINKFASTTIVNCRAPRGPHAPGWQAQRHRCRATARAGPRERRSSHPDGPTPRPAPGQHVTTARRARRVPPRGARPSGAATRSRRAPVGSCVRAWPCPKCRPNDRRNRSGESLPQHPLGSDLSRAPTVEPLGHQRPNRPKSSEISRIRRRPHRARAPRTPRKSE